MNDVLETFVDWKAFEYKYSNNLGMDKERVKKEKQVSKTQEKQEEWVMTKLMEKFIQNMALTESVFELLELAYRTLEKEIDNQAVFIAKYMTQSPENDSNPNRLRLSIFHQEVELLFADYSSIKYIERKTIIENKMKNIQLKRYGSPRQNDLSVVFQLLLAINSAADNWNKFRIRKQWGALNGCTGKYAVYFWDEQTYMNELKEYIGTSQHIYAVICDCISMESVSEFVQKAF